MRRQPAMGCVGFLLLLALLVPATAAAKETMEVQRFHELLQELREADPPVMALNPATELVELRGFLSRRLFVETMEAFLTEPDLKLYPAAESMLVTELADAYFQAAEFEQSDALLARYGFILNWWTIGPFSGNGIDELNTPFPPETNLDMDAVMDGAIPGLRWVEALQKNRAGRFTRTDDEDAKVDYFTTSIEVEKEQDALLWLEGDLHFILGTERTATKAQGYLEAGYGVHLEEGENRLTIKCQCYDIHVRLTAIDGSVLDFGTLEHPTLSTFPADVTDMKPTVSPLDELVAVAEVREVGDLARTARTLEYWELTDWRPFLDTALALAPCDQTVAHSAVRLLGSHEFDLLTCAVQTYPRDPWLLYYSWLFEPRFEDLRHLKELEPDSTITKILDIDALSYELPVSRQRLIERAVLAGEDAPLFATHFYLDDGDPRTGREVASAITRLVPWEGRSELALWDLRDGDEAGALHRVISNYWATLMTLRLLAALRSAETIRTTFDTLFFLYPLDHELHEAYADWLLKNGEQDAAIAHYERALQIEEDASLRAMLDYLGQAAPSSAAQWLVTEPGTMPAVKGQDYGQLVDLEVVAVSPNGVSTQVQQTTLQVFTTEGAERLRSQSVWGGNYSYDVTFDLQVTHSDGRSPATPRREERGAYWVVDVGALEPGDLIDLTTTTVYQPSSYSAEPPLSKTWFPRSTLPTKFYRRVVSVPEGTTLSVFSPDNVTYEVHQEANNTAHVFTAEDLASLEVEPDMLAYSELSEPIQLSAFADWDQFAQWYWKQVEPKLIADDAIREAVATLTAEPGDERELVRRIYEFVLDHTRYVSEPFGEHDIIPYEAPKTLAQGFGDCKDKSALLKVLLAEAHIDSDLVIVRTRDLGQIDTQVPSVSLFNHVIVYVPSLDLYLDPTAELSGVDELPTGDQGAIGLLVRDGGCELVRIPEQPVGSNVREQRFTIQLGEDGTRLQGTVKVSGRMAPYYRRALHNEDERVEAIEPSLEALFPKATLTTLSVGSLERSKDVEYELTAEADSLLLDGVEQVYTYPLGASSDLTLRLAAQKERENALDLSSPMTSRTVFRYELPDTWELEGPLPESLVIDTDFVHFSLEARRVDHGFELEVNHQLEVWSVPADQYPAFREALKTIEAALDTPVRLRRRP